MEVLSEERATARVGRKGAFLTRLCGVLAAFAAAICLGGCAAQNVASVPMVQPGDDQLACAQIADQIKSNTLAEAQAQKSDEDVAQMNVAKNVVASPISLTTDLSDKDQVEARSLADRNERLQYLAKSKGCTQ